MFSKVPKSGRREGQLLQARLRRCPGGHPDNPVRVGIGQGLQ